MAFFTLLTDFLTSWWDPQGGTQENKVERDKVGGQEGESMHQVEDVLLTVT